MNAIIAFRASIGEVNSLASMAESHEDDDILYSALNKSAILLLCSKFEAFIETLVEEFVYEVARIGLNCEHLPLDLRLAVSKQALREIQDIVDDAKFRARAPSTLEYISGFWRAPAFPENINLNCSFDYGKHGEKAIRKLFSQIGIQDVFSECEISIPKESISDDEDFEIIGAQGTINSMVGYRNSITHNDSDTQLTHTQIDEYIFKTVKFAEKLDECVAGRVSKLRDHQANTPADSRELLEIHMSLSLAL